MGIHILSDDVITKIAAGEVVERPASAVKELIENALDAGSSQISVIIREGGKRFIEVTDNGYGIPSIELPLAVTRHATSKLNKADDLFAIHTLGFRGEALASIGAVAKLTVTSRYQDERVGSRIVVEGGIIQAHERIATASGTQVRVEDIFFNMPARLKFLKQDSTERNLIQNQIMRYSFCYPNTRFLLEMEGRKVFRTNGNGDRREVLAAVYGLDIAKQMLEVNFEEDGFTVQGFISPISLTRSNRREITFFVNGRWIQDTALTTAMLQAYRTMIMVGRYPIASLMIDLPPDMVDVNVHPAKSEIRFRNPDQVFVTVQRATRRALLSYSPVPSIVSESTWQFQTGSGKVRTDGWGDSIGLAKQAIINTTESEEQPDNRQNIPESIKSNQLPYIDKLPLLRLVGQIGLTYLVAEGPDGLYLIDQHAAHERVLYEKFLRNTAQQEIASQSLLAPVAIELTPSQAKVLESYLRIVNLLGFQVEPFGLNTFQVRRIPVLLGNMDPALALRALVEDFEEDESPLQAEHEERIIARICKRAAVKAGQKLSEAEQANLLLELENCQSPRTCPHGRPTMIHLSVDLLERQFGRRGSR